MGPTWQMRTHERPAVEPATTASANVDLPLPGGPTSTTTTCLRPCSSSFASASAPRLGDGGGGDELEPPPSGFIWQNGGGILCAFRGYGDGIMDKGERGEARKGRKTVRAVLAVRA